MDRVTVEIYERRAPEWDARRGCMAGRERRALALASVARAGGWRVDLGSGPGKYTAALGRPAVALDAAFAMVTMVRQRLPDVPAVQADLEALPFRDGALAAAWASMSYLHVPRDRLPLALARLHWATEVAAPVDIAVHEGTYQGHADPEDDFPGRFYADWQPDDLRDVFLGAGFAVDGIERVDNRSRRATLQLRAQRIRSLPDTVGPGMRLLVCGLNPSVYAADRGVGYARPGNRFWAAALQAGIVTRPRDPLHALHEHGIGMTDLVKRATVAARELTADEYREGAARVERLVRWLRPAAVCFVGLDGWRRAIDRRARPGRQPQAFAGAPAYVMPSTSGLNARTPVTDLAGHLRAARLLGEQARAGSS